MYVSVPDCQDIDQNGDNWLFGWRRVRALHACRDVLLWMNPRNMLMHILDSDCPCCLESDVKFLIVTLKKKTHMHGKLELCSEEIR